MTKARLTEAHGPDKSAPAMTATLSEDDLFRHLDGLGIVTVTADHAPAFTVEDSRALCAGIPGGHCKNLFLKDERGDLFLIVALQDTEIHLNRMHKRIGCKRLSFGRPDLLMQVLGVTPGSVTPFALLNDRARRVSVILDAAMMALDPLNYHPLRNDRTTTIARADLLRFLASTGHSWRVLDLAPEPALGLPSAP